MLIVDFEATRQRIKDRCVAVRRVATKYGITDTTMRKFVNGHLFGTSGQGVYGRCENALIDMGLLVFTVSSDEKSNRRRDHEARP